MADYKLSELTEKTTFADTDIMHLRTVGAIDQKITWANILKKIIETIEPVGTIKIFDANNAGGGGSPGGASGAWVDNTTIPNWYACIAGNSDHGCPNMVDKFIMGKVIAGAGGTGGSNTVILSAANLPVHTHAIDHNHPVKTSSIQSASHKHDTVMGTHGHDKYTREAGTTHSANDTSRDIEPISGRQNHLITTTDLGTKESGDQKTSHTHTVDLDNFSGPSGNGGFANDAHENRPAYYSVIVIRKCA